MFYVGKSEAVRKKGRETNPQEWNSCFHWYLVSWNVSRCSLKNGRKRSLTNIFHTNPKSEIYFSFPWRHFGSYWLQTKIQIAMGSSGEAHLRRNLYDNGKWGSVRGNKNGPPRMTEWVERSGIRHMISWCCPGLVSPDVAEVVSFQWVTRGWAILFLHQSFTHLSESWAIWIRIIALGEKKKERKRNTALKDGIIFHIFVNLKDKG